MSEDTSFQKCGLYCDKCGEPAVWIYIEIGMQITYCNYHAKHDKLFGRTDTEVFMWKRIPFKEQEVDRAISIPGSTKTLKELAARIPRLRFDIVAQFYGDTATELERQATDARSKGKKIRAELLEEAVVTARGQQLQFAQLWALYKPQIE